MQPTIELLSKDLITRILDESFCLLMEPGVKIQDEKARTLLMDAGATAVDQIIHIPEKLIRTVLETTPDEFWLYDRNVKPVVHYGGNDVHFDPGSSGVHILDSQTGNHRPAVTDDLVRLVKVTEMLPAYDAQSTAVVCSEIPKSIGDLYRLFIVLLFSSKPVVTGAFSNQSLLSMIEMLEICAGDRKTLIQKPLAVFDVCPSPPLTWSSFGAQNLILLAQTSTPVELVSMPLAGAAAPVTLLGSVVQHAVETLSGIAIHQLANPGAPVVWGGAPAIFDMRHGTTPMGAVETAMIDIAYAQVGKSLGLPTHGYLGASDAKIVDAQAGLESSMSALLGALAGINMISGAGMLDFLACQSIEKLIIDAEWIGMIKRVLAGLELRTETLATAFFQDFKFKGDFLLQKLTRDLFPLEQFLPSLIIDRDSLRGWQESGALDSYARAICRANELIQLYNEPAMDVVMKQDLWNYVEKLAQDSGLEKIPLTRDKME